MSGKAGTIKLGVVVAEDRQACAHGETARGHRFWLGRLFPAGAIALQIEAAVEITAALPPAVLGFRFGRDAVGRGRTDCDGGRPGVMGS